MGINTCKGICVRDPEYVGIRPHDWCVKGYKQCNPCNETFNTIKLSCSCCGCKFRVFPRKTKNRELVRKKLKERLDYVSRIK